jgi:hypothetical protein
VVDEPELNVGALEGHRRNQERLRHQAEEELRH